MKIRFKRITLETIGLYVLLALSSLLVPRNVMELSYFWFWILIGGYIYLWYKIIRRQWYQLNDNNPKDNWDFLVYDLIYILGLPIIFNLIMFKVGRNLFHEPLYFYAYYLFVGVVVLMKLGLMANRGKGYYVFRYAITVLFILGNAIIVNQIFTIWFGMNYMGQGF